jgi:hypothetical protein
MSVDTLNRLTIPTGEPLLRLALAVDAVVTGVNGAAYLAGADLLDSLLGLPSTMLRITGGFLLAFAAVVGFVATRHTIRLNAAAAILAVNAAWVVGSAATLVFGWYSPTPGGGVWIALQALVVALFAVLQFEGRAEARS